MYQMKNLAIFLFLLFCANSIAVSASHIDKTHIVTADNSEPIVLDCDFDAIPNNSTLVVKWLKEGKPIYQWIKGHVPTVYPSMKGLIDEEYEISSNSNFKHRAISFPVPTKEMTGTYKCLVETMDSTQIIQTYLQVIDVSQLDIELESSVTPNDTLVTCEVENVYPEPRLLIWSNDDVALSKVSEKITTQEDGLFDATVVASASDIDTDEIIGCTLQFPGTTYNVTKILKSSAGRTSAVGFVIVFLLFAIST